LDRSIAFQSEFFREYDLMLPPSSSSIFSVPFGHPVGAYAFFLVVPSFISFLQYCVLGGSSHARKGVYFIIIRNKLQDFENYFDK
jgi:hypothetical protein